MIYSLTERKCGKYFDEDLYECSFELNSSIYSSTDNSFIIDLDASVDKVINVEGFILAADSNKYSLDTYTANNAFINTIMYDKSNEQNAAIYVHSPIAVVQAGEGVIKVQYTKTATE